MRNNETANRRQNNRVTKPIKWEFIAAVLLILLVIISFKASFEPNELRILD